ncbi:MAG: metal ABC transporter ATP-binding protein [Myxococcota bacterium]
MTDSPLACEALVVGYGGRALLPPITVAFGRGEFWAVVGRNGSGKTTWFKTMLGLMRPLSGQVSAQGARLSYVPQRTGYDDLWPVTAGDVVAMGLERGGSFFRPGPRLGVADALAAVGATELGGRPFRALSEGQKQRVLLARVVASRADVVFLDEPTAAMDSVAEEEALTLLDDVRKRFGTTIVVVSHFLGVAREHADRVLFVDRPAQAVVVGTPDDVFTHPIFQSRYGRLAEPAHA